MINADDMQSWAYLLAPTFQFVNTAGKPLTEGWIEVYIAGTRNKYYCASDFNGTLHPFQIPLDSLGANIVLANPDQAYDVYVYNKYGSLVMSRYHVSPGMAGGSGVLNITITSEDGTVSVNNNGNGNFDLSIKDTVDRIEVLEQTVSDLSSNSSVGYAIAHAYTVELDGSFDLISDAVTGIGYTPNMDGFRLKSGHVYQFNFNALFENGEFDRNCSGKLYLEGPNTIAQEWKFDLDDSYYHSQSINGSTVLVTPNDLNYYDVKLKLAWDVDYPNKPNVDLNKISIVDITTILSTTVSGVGGNYTGGDGILVNDETYVISVDMDYINSHLNIDATEIIASAVNIATAYTDARVTSVSGDLVNLIAEVSASIPTGSVTQVQSDWNQTNSSSVDYIKNKPEEYGLLAGDNISITASGSNFIISSTASASTGTNYQAGYGIDITGDTISVDASIIPSTSDYATHTEVNNVSAAIIAQIPEQQINSDWTATSGVAEILNKPNESELIAGAGVSITASGSNYIISAVVTGSPVISGYVTEAELQTVSGNIVNQIPDVSNMATKQEVETVSGTLNTKIDNVSAAIPELPLEEEVEFEELDLNKYALVSEIPDVSNLATKQEVATVSGMIPDISGLATNADLQIVSASIPDISSLATEAELQIVSAAIPNVSQYATHSEVNTVSGTIVSLIPDVSSLASKSEVNAVSGTLQTEIVAISGAMVDVPTGVSGVVAGQGIAITASGSDYVISCTVTGGGAGDVTRAELVSVSGTLETEIQVVSAAIPDTSNLATKSELQTVSAAIPDVSNLSTKVEVATASGTLNTKIDNVSASIPTLPSEEEVEFEEIDLNDYALVSEIPDVSNLATKSELQTVSAAIPDVSNFVTGPTVSAIVDEALIDIPTGVSGVVAGDGISITASGSDYIISCTVTGVGSGTTYTAGDYIGIVDDTISVTGVTDVVAGNCVSITSSGNSAVIDWTTTGGITDIQIVNSLPASPVSTVLYLIPET